MHIYIYINEILTKVLSHSILGFTFRSVSPKRDLDKDKVGFLLSSHLLDHCAENSKLNEMLLSQNYFLIYKELMASDSQVRICVSIYIYIYTCTHTSHL